MKIKGKLKHFNLPKNPDIYISHNWMVYVIQPLYHTTSTMYFGNFSHYYITELDATYYHQCVIISMVDFHLNGPKTKCVLTTKLDLMQKLLYRMCNQNMTRKKEVKTLCHDFMTI